MNAKVAVFCDRYSALFVLNMRLSVSPKNTGTEEPKGLHFPRKDREAVHVATIQGIAGTMCDVSSFGESRHTQWGTGHPNGGANPSNGAQARYESKLACNLAKTNCMHALRFRRTSKTSFHF